LKNAMSLPVTAARPFDPWQSSLPKRLHDVRRLAPKFETPTHAQAEKKRRQHQLRKTGRQAELALAWRLRACRSGKRCLLPICPRCMRRFRIWFSSEVLQLFANEPELIFVTIIPPRANPPNGKLAEFEAKRSGDWLRQSLHRLRCKAPVIGGLDGTFEQSLGEWQLHYHLIVPCSARPMIDALRRYCRETSTGSAPVVIHDVPPEDRARMVSYCCKGFWQERIHYTGRDGKRRSSKRRLNGRQHLAWLKWRGSHDLAELLFLYGARRYGSTILPAPASQRPLPRG
jgi:hypothetical protein